MKSPNECVGLEIKLLAVSEVICNNGGKVIYTAKIEENYSVDRQVYVSHLAICDGLVIAIQKDKLHGLMEVIIDPHNPSRVITSGIILPYYLDTRKKANGEVNVNELINIHNSVVISKYKITNLLKLSFTGK